MYKYTIHSTYSAYIFSKAIHTHTDCSYIQYIDIHKKQTKNCLHEYNKYSYNDSKLHLHLLSYIHSFKHTYIHTYIHSNEFIQTSINT